MQRLFVDVDDTLVLYQTGDGPHPYGVYMGVPWEPNEKLIEGIHAYKMENPSHSIFIWSGGGKDYAKMWAEKLGLDELVTCLDKGKDTLELIREGDLVIDDEPVSWRTHSPHEWPEPIAEEPHA